MRLMAARKVNEIDHIGAFLRRWLVPDEPVAPPSRSRRSSKGNINLAGTVGASRSALLAPTDPGFLMSVEPGVRDLVAAFVQIGAITYTSCEGHDYGGDVQDERHVGVLIRNDAEACRLERMWRTAESLVSPPLELGMMRHSVKSQGHAVRAIDFYLTCGDDVAASEYFAALAATSERLAQAIPLIWVRQDVGHGE